MNAAVQAIEARRAIARKVAEATDILIRRGWSDEEASALIEGDVLSPDYENSRLKLVEHVPEAEDYGIFFYHDSRFVCDPVKVQNRLGLDDAEMEILGQAERHYVESAK